MATAADTFTWEDHGDDLKAWLGISGTAEDVWLITWLLAAAKDCDKIIGWKYIDLDGEAVDVTPTDPSANPTIFLGIYEWVRAYRAAFHGIAPGRKAARTGAISETYGGGASGAVCAKIARAAAVEIWGFEIINTLNSGKGE